VHQVQLFGTNEVAGVIYTETSLKTKMRSNPRGRGRAVMGGGGGLPGIRNIPSYATMTDIDMPPCLTLGPPTEQKKYCTHPLRPGFWSFRELEQCHRHRVRLAVSPLAMKVGRFVSHTHLHSESCIYREVFKS